jgi:UDP-3-O-[3-hydroxymyristoyl] glucosamine N-acyltransferase
MAITARHIAEVLKADLLGPGDVAFDRMDSIDRAGPGALTFIRSHRFARRWPQSRAAGAIITRDLPLPDLIPGFDAASPASPRPLIVVPDADLALITCLPLFASPRAARAPGVHPSAVIEPGCRIDPSACIGPLCVLGPGAVVEAGAVLVSQVRLGEQARIGPRTLVHPHAAILDGCEVGSDCVIHSGVVIGADGFGFLPAPGGKGLLKVPHIGNVVIGDHVEIGAGSCIDRAKFGSTTIGSGTKIDNLVQVAHGCRIGRSCVLCGQVGLSGSVILGDGVILGGKVGVAEGLEVGAGARVAALSGITGNVPEGAAYMGAPAGPVGEWRRAYATLRRLGKRPQHPEV